MLSKQRRRAGYIERNWPPAFKESGAWPFASLRQSFLNGALTRLLDPDNVLRDKVPNFVVKGDFGLGSGQKADGTYDRIWHAEMLSPDEVQFEANVFLLTKARAKALKGQATTVTIPSPAAGPEEPGPSAGPTPSSGPEPEPDPSAKTRTIRLVGTIPPEIWNRLGTKIIPKLKSGSDLKIGVDFSVTVNVEAIRSLESDLRQIIQDLGLREKIKIE